MQLTSKYLQRLLLIETREVGVRAECDTAFTMIPEYYGYAEHIKNWQSGKVPPISQLLARVLEPMRVKLKSLIPSSAVAGSPFLETADDAAAGGDPPALSTAAIHTDAEAA